MIGWLLMDTVVLPLSRMFAPPPSCPPVDVTVIPGAAACSMSITSMGLLGSSAVLIWLIVLPISRRRDAPAVPVTTISSRPSTWVVSWKSTSAVAPAVTVTCWDPAAKPILSARIS